MTTLLTAIKIFALLGSIVLPLSGPKKKKTESLHETGNLCVNEHGYLEYLVKPLLGTSTKF